MSESNQEELKVLELFGGIGAIRKAFERQNIPHKVVDYVEIDEFAVKSYNAMFGTNFEPQDISKWDKDIEVDFIMHGSPCFVAGTKIWTKDGFKNIEDIQVGDEVLTHTHNYQKVLKIGHNENKEVLKITNKYAPAQFEKVTIVTPNHPFYTMHLTEQQKILLNSDEQVKLTDEPYWKAIGDLAEDEYIGFMTTDKVEVKKYNNGNTEINKPMSFISVKDLLIEKVPETYTVYNMEVENDNSYVANGYVVHNCQDFSIAGLQRGGDEGSGTRSSLMYETVRLVKKLNPKYVVWENVKNLVSDKHYHNFRKYLNTMEDFGYNNYYQVLNAKDYGVPQNRERVFTVSIRKDIDHKQFYFPDKQPLTLRLKDLLETNVDEKYYLSDEKIASISQWKSYQKPFESVLGNNSISPTLTARGAGEEHAGMITYSDEFDNTTNVQDKLNEVNRLGGLYDTDDRQRQSGAIYDKEGLAPTLSTGHGLDRPFIIDDKEKPTNVNKIGSLYNDDNASSQGGSIYDKEGLAPTITTGHGYAQPFVVDENTNKVIQSNLVQKVKVRTYPVDTEKLQTLLKDSKSNSNLTNENIASKLNIPITQVEHYFRTDDSFAIPSPEIWPNLKKILNITDDSLDKSIMTFEEKESNYDMHNRAYHTNGIAPTIDTNNDKKIIEYKGKEVELPAGCASRGRNLENPNDRTPGQKLQQTIEINTEGTSNCLTTFEKDNYVLEPDNRDLKYVGSIKNKDIVGDGKDLSRNASMGDRVYDSNGVSATISAQGGGVGGHSGLYTVNDEDDDPDIDNPLKGISGQSWQFEQNVYSENSKCIRTIKAGEGSGNIPKIIENKQEQMQQLADEINKNAKHQQDLVQTENDEYARTIVAGTHGNASSYTKTIVSDNTNRIIEHNPNAKHQHEMIQDELGISRCVLATSHASTGDHLKTVVREDTTKNKKQQLCDYMVKNNLVEPYDVINHGYTEHRFESLQNQNDIVMSKNMAPTITTRPDELGVAVETKSVFTETDSKMITEDGNVKRYINSDIVDKFEEGQIADISFPNGYNKGPRVHNECPTINGTTVQSFITKENSGVIIGSKRDNSAKSEEGIVPTLTAGMGMGGGNIPMHNYGLRIRKLTPKECWRLMGFDDEDFEKAEKVNSNAQLYKQAGNSIVVNVLEAILNSLFRPDPNLPIRKFVKKLF